MSAPQVTFLLVTVGGSALGTVLTYPGVRKHAATARSSLLAAFMASAMAATGLGFFCGALVNALSAP
jgi:hypothetical protein